MKMFGVNTDKKRNEMKNVKFEITNSKMERANNKSDSCVCQ